MADTHTFSEDRVPHPSKDGNLTEIVPICSCGWRGYGIASYNDDLFSRLRRQEARHLRDSAIVRAITSTNAEER